MDIYSHCIESEVENSGFTLACKLTYFGAVVPDCFDIS